MESRKQKNINVKKRSKVDIIEEPEEETEFNMGMEDEVMVEN